MVMPAIADLIHSLSGNNQFASGGLLLMAIGAIGASLRKLPAALWDWALRQTTLSLIVTDESEGFLWFKWWFSAQPVAGRTRQADLYTPVIGGGRGIFFLLAPGNKWFWHSKRLCIVSFSRKETENGGYSSKRTESFTLATWGRNQRFLYKWMEEMREAYEEQFSQVPRLYYWNRDGWTSSPSYSPRPLSTVVLPADLKDRIVKDIQRFHTSETWYKEMGIPYHRGYLLYGPCGTGKTALVMGLSSFLKTRVYIVRLNEMTDSSLADAIADITPGTIVLFEDVDCVVPEARHEAGEPVNAPEDKDTPKLRGVSLAGLLNVLDGVQAPNNVLFFMTTNCPEKLDKALTRPGRIDVKVEMHPATAEQKTEMFSRFFSTQEPVPSYLLADNCTMAEFQERLLERRNAA